jgi:hypothetical protein
MRTANLLLRAALLLTAAWAASPASAETHELATTTVGALAEGADLAVLAEAGDAPLDPDAPWTFDVTETLRGTRAETVRVDVAGRRADVRPGASYLLFLRSRPDGRYAPLSRFALRRADLPETQGLVRYAQEYTATLDADGAAARPDALRDLLVRSLSSADSGVPFCAGLDLVRHVDLHQGVSPAHQAAIAAALLPARKADLDLGGILEAAGALGDGRVDAPLIDRLLDPDVRTLRRYVTRALVRRKSPELAELLVARIDGADAAGRGDIANALGKMGAPEAEQALVALLKDGEAPVRLEAAHAVGRLARAVRAKPVEARDDPAVAEKPRPRLDGALAPLLAFVQRAATRNERKAGVWALAQIDTQDAWAALRRLRDREDSDPELRRLATRYLKQPRVALLFD